MLNGRVGWSLLLSLCISLGEAQSIDKTQTGPELGYHWAVLVAGSRFFYNYRHQADVCHAYQLLKANGMDDYHVITMVYDDIAHNPQMPDHLKGKLFNVPGGQDVYPGCAKDYTGFDVNAQNFWAIMNGDKETVQGVGSGRVLESGPESNIFLFYSGHGSPGALYFPTGGPIYAHALNDGLRTMHDGNMYNELVVYLEACESASMFQGVLASDIGIYALSAANSTEISWAIFCPRHEDHGSSSSRSNLPDHIGACLGDLFSVSWMVDTTLGDLRAETLHEQFVRVRQWTAPKESNQFQGSSVEQFGNIAMDRQVIGNFLSVVGHEITPPSPTAGGVEFLSRFPHLSESDPLFEHSHRLPWKRAAVEQRDADLVFFMHRAHSAKSTHEADEMLGTLRKVLLKREELDSAIRNAVKVLHIGGHVRHHSTDLYMSLEHYIKGAENRHGRALVDDWECLKDMVEVWEQKCGKLDEYGIKYSHTFANLCNAGVKPSVLADSVNGTCSSD